MPVGDGGEGFDPRVGLCSRCDHSRVTGNRRGSRFYLCRLAAIDPAFRKYPPLPVWACSGFDLAPNVVWPGTDEDS